MFLRIIRYFRVVTDIPELEFYGQGNNHYFVIHVPDEVQPESIDAFISVLLKSCLQGSVFHPYALNLDVQNLKI